MATLIVINGAPGVGKTTLLHWLEAKLELPGLSKDDIKEFLFERMGHSYRDRSRILGRGSVEALYVLAEEFLNAGQSVLIENAFWPQFAAPALQRLIKRTHCKFVEIYCYTDEETRLVRFQGRFESGARHPGHVDNLGTLADSTDYKALEIGKILRFDTTSVRPVDNSNLLDELRKDL